MQLRRLVFAPGLLLVPVVAAAQPAEPAPTQPEPEPAPTEPAPVEPAPAAAATVTDPPAVEPSTVVAAPGPNFTWEPFGYLRLKAAIVQNDPNVAFVGRDDGFALQNARLGVRGTLTFRAAFVVSIDGAVDERDRINSPDGKLRVGLRDAFVDLHVLGGSGAVPIDVRAGRFDAVFDPDHLEGDTERPFVDRALESRGVLPTEGWETAGLPPGRSIGVALRKEAPRPTAGVALGFELAVQNGADEFSADNDNDLPAVSAAIFARLAGGGRAMAAARWNPRTEGDLPFRQDETDLEAAAGLALDAGPVQVGAGGVFVHTIFDTTGGPAQNAYGAHAQALFTFDPDGWAPIGIGYRFAILDPSDLVLTDRVMEHTAGAVIALRRWHLRGQLNVTHAVEQADRDLSNDRIEAALEIDL
jgi:hypothetical protein